MSNEVWIALNGRRQRAKPVIKRAGFFLFETYGKRPLSVGQEAQGLT